MNIPTLDLHAQFKTVEAEVRAAMERVLASQHFILGPEVSACEEEIARYSQAKYAVGVSSGTDAILVALMALGVGPGDEVITTPYTFVATVTCIARLGARAVFVDIDPRTYALDATKLRAAITERTKAIVPVHLFGQMADMNAILEIAGSIPVLEDGAQAIGAVRDERPMGRGSIGATLSFFPSKNLGCLGDGGMVITDDEAFAHTMRLLRNQGQQPKYTSQRIGGNLRLDALQAAVVRAKLPFLDGWITARSQHAEHYRRAFAAAAIPSAQLTLPYQAPNTRHVYNQFVVQTSRRDALMQRLTDEEIGSAVYYPVPMHLQPCFASWGHREGDFPVAERAAKETLALPLYPELAAAAIDHVVATVTDFFREVA